MDIKFIKFYVCMGISLAASAVGLIILFA